MQETETINFSPKQALPPGYRVEWWECDEHYHWVGWSVDEAEAICGPAECDRFAARRGAIAHYEAQQ